MPRTSTLRDTLSQMGDKAPAQGQDYREQVTRLLWEFAATGKVVLEDQIITAESAADWLEAVRWLVEEGTPREIGVRVLRQSSTPASAFHPDLILRPPLPALPDD